jgi:hypothetical protein
LFSRFRWRRTVQNTRRIALLAAAALVLPVAAHAQTGTPAPAQPAAPAAAPATSPAAEIAQLQQKIGQLQQQALADPSLKAATDSFNAVVSAAMGRVDPQAPAKIARAQAIPTEVAAARTANDNAKLNQLATEANDLQTYFTQLRPRAMQDPAVQTARQAYLARVLARMKEIDPNTQQYVDRLTELSQQQAGAH